ncbi:hypothetical protein V6C27_00485 [Peptococcaceae bacterium 1198_IL3148]
MFNPLYARDCLTDRNAKVMDQRIIHNHVLILPDGREILIDYYHPNQGGNGWLKYPFAHLTFKTISELLDK